MMMMMSGIYATFLAYKNNLTSNNGMKEASGFRPGPEPAQFVTQKDPSPYPPSKIEDTPVNTAFISCHTRTKLNSTVAKI